MQKWQRWLPLGIMVSILYYCSSIPGLRVVPKHWLPAWLNERLAAYSWNIGGSGFFAYTLSLQPEFVLRKLAHVGAFMLVGICAYLAVRSRSKAILLAVTMALTDELHQAFVPGRDCRLGDIVLDSLAAVVAVFSYCYFKQRRQ